ncbi:MAG TPA: hypothetical protein VIX73_13155 [Kofleriaceae bacterium]
MAAADGEIHDLERCLAAGIQRHILGTDDDFEASGPSSPASWPRESRRQRLRFDAVALSAMSATRRSLSRQVSTDGCALHRDGARASPTSWSGFKGLLDKQDGGAVLAQGVLACSCTTIVVRWSRSAPYRSRETAEGARLGSDKQGQR